MKGTPKKTAEKGKPNLRGKKGAPAGPKRKAPVKTKRAAPRRKEPVPPRKVEFHFSGIEAREVFLSGSFNDWDLHSLPLEKSPQEDWNTVIPLLPGRYEFKAQADGAWIEDGICEVRVEGAEFTLSLPTETAFNPFGTKNSAVLIQ
jgi:hypothetical protein